MTATRTETGLAARDDRAASTAIDRAPSRPLAPEARFARDVFCIAGLPFDAVTLAQTVQRLRVAAETRTRCFLSTPNLDFAVGAATDAAFRNSVLNSDLSVIDGAPLVWIARALGLPIRERVAGASLFEALRAHPGAPLRVYFFGGPPGAAEAACHRLQTTRTGLQAVGFDAAGFGSVEEMSSVERIARINASGADFVVVSLGAKKGQAWIERNAAALDAPLLCHLGAVVNFVAGTVARAPDAWQGLGLEWLWRIKEEPTLWRRYAHDGRVLAGWLVTRVLPMAWALRRARSEGASAVCAIDRSVPRTLRIGLAGAWTRTELGPLRAAFAEAAAAGLRIELDLHRAEHVDAAFIGLLLLARGSFGPERLRLDGAAPTVRRALRRHGAGFLVGES